LVPDAPVLADALVPPEVYGVFSFFLVQPRLTMAMANTTLIAPTNRWEIAIDFSFGLS
jgi:hypothetical protein